MQKARRHACALRPLVGAWFQGLFHSSVRGSAIGLSGVFSLTGWSPPIRPGFLVSWVTQVSIRLLVVFAYRAVTVSGYDFHRILLTPFLVFVMDPFRVRSPLLAESLLFSFPAGT